jgi:radical SAM protein with 4Fe4S-binding SPASM domain
MAGVTVAVISSRGEARACTHIPHSTGNILSDSLDSLWAKMVNWRDGTLIPKVCKDCRALGICGGGCRADALVANGSLDAPDPLMSTDDVEAAIKEHQRFMEENSSKGDLPPFIQINPELRWRAEPFGSVCFLNNQCAGVFNADTTELLFTELKSRTVDSAKLAQSVPISFLKDLYAKQVLISGPIGVPSLHEAQSNREGQL